MAQTESDIDKIKEIVREIEKTVQCTCDLDRWEPTKETGHSWVCNIHKEALKSIHEGGSNGTD